MVGIVNAEADFKGHGKVEVVLSSLLCQLTVKAEEGFY
jgi:hypothetical protein